MGKLRLTNDERRYQLLQSEAFKQPHKTRSRGLGGPGGPLNSSTERAILAVRAGARGNVGLTGRDWEREEPKPLRFTPALSKRFSSKGRCKVCALYPDTYGTTQLIDGSGYCLEHAHVEARQDTVWAWLTGSQA